MSRDNGQPLYCHAPDCPHPRLYGAECFDDRDALSGKAPDGRGHALIGGKPWHFRCLGRWMRRVTAGDSEAI